MATSSLVRSFAFVVAPLIGASLASAAFITPSFRPTSTAGALSSLTTYQEWTAELSLTANAPNIASYNPSGTATFNANANGYVTSTGHLYSFYGPMPLSVVVPAFATVPGLTATKFVVQIDNDGSELIPTTNNVPDYSGFQIDGTSINTLAGFSYTELSRVTESMVQGGQQITSNNVESEFTFTLPGTVSSSHTFTYTVPQNNAEYHLAVDTQVVATPEPAMLSLIAFALPVALRRKR